MMTQHLSLQGIGKLYAVRNQAGQWFRAKGYGGSGDSWCNDFTKARIYTKIGGAKGRVSWFARHHPDYGVPDIVELHITKMLVID